MNTMVLVIDDDPLQWSNYGISLEELGCKPHFAPDEITTLQLTSQNEYRVILLDLGIGPSSGQMDDGRSDLQRGEALFWKLKEITKVPIIIVTIYKGSAPADAAIKRMSPDAVIEKPFLPEDLRVCVRDALKQGEVWENS